VDSEFTFKAISYELVGLLWVTTLVISLISMRKESRAPIVNHREKRHHDARRSTIVLMIVGAYKIRYSRAITRSATKRAKIALMNSFIYQNARRLGLAAKAGAVQRAVSRKGRGLEN
jgi:hypothetical protein